MSISCWPRIFLPSTLLWWLWKICRACGRSEVGRKVKCKRESRCVLDKLSYDQGRGLSRRCSLRRPSSSVGFLLGCFTEANYQVLVDVFLTNFFFKFGSGFERCLVCSIWKRWKRFSGTTAFLLNNVWTCFSTALRTWWVHLYSKQTLSKILKIQDLNKTNAMLRTMHKMR